MIRYKLNCKNCEISFDSWFASSKEYEKLKKKSLLNCHVCNSRQVEKSLMAPKLINKPISKSFDNENLKFKKITNKIKEYQKFIKNNFEFVGKNFAYEARSIHYNAPLVAATPAARQDSSSRAGFNKIAAGTPAAGNPISWDSGSPI